jgi:hypothetical protein
MNPSSLKSSSFVAYFSHLPPQIAIERCNRLNGAAEICSDADNWKAYIAKRYGLKFSVQRPDLITAEEWQAQAVALEEVDLNWHFDDWSKVGMARYAIPEGRNRYVAVIIEGFQNGGVLFTYAELKAYFKAHPIIFDDQAIEIPLFLPGIPVVVSDYSRQITFHAVKFRAQVHFENSQDYPNLGPKLPHDDATTFESPTQAHQWLLELFIPYYTKFMEYGYTLNNVDELIVDHTGHTVNNVLAGIKFDQLLDRLMSFVLAQGPFNFRVKFTHPNEQMMVDRYGRDAVRASIDLEYIPVKLL